MIFEFIFFLVTEADPTEFLNVINDPNYPKNQNVVRLFDLPNYCNEDMIKILLFGMYTISII